MIRSNARSTKLHFYSRCLLTTRNLEPAKDYVLRLKNGRRVGVCEYGSIHSSASVVFWFHGLPFSRLEPLIYLSAFADAKRPELSQEEAKAEQATRPARSSSGVLEAIRLIALDRPGFGESDADPQRSLLSYTADVEEV